MSFTLTVQPSVEDVSSRRQTDDEVASEEKDRVIHVSSVVELFQDFS